MEGVGSVRCWASRGCCAQNRKLGRGGKGRKRGAGDCPVVGAHQVLVITQGTLHRFPFLGFSNRRNIGL